MAHRRSTSTFRAAEQPSGSAGSDAGRRRLLRAGWAALVAPVGLQLTGCSGGSETSSPATPSDDAVRLPLGGVDSGGTGMVAQAFVAGSIAASVPLVVHGVGYDTTGADLRDADDQPLAPTDLLPGMTCRIDAQWRQRQGSPAGARALAVRVGEQLLGPLTGVPAADGTFSVLGQGVRVTADTVFDASLAQGLAGLDAGDLVQVWGHHDPGADRIVATRVGAPATAGVQVVRGTLTALDLAARRARIGGLQMAWTDDTAIEPGLAVAALVRVRLAWTAAPDGADAAARVLSMRADPLRLPDQVKAEIEGRITRVDSARRLAVDGVEVELGQGLAPPTPLALGQKLLVKGRSVQGMLQASSLQVEDEPLLEIEGRISAANGAARSFVLDGVTVRWTDATRFEGGGAGLLAAGRKAQVLGRWSKDRSALLATRIHVEA